MEKTNDNGPSAVSQTAMIAPDREVWRSASRRIPISATRNATWLHTMPATVTDIPSDAVARSRIGNRGKKGHGVWWWWACATAAYPCIAIARYQRPSQLPKPVSAEPCPRSMPMAMSSAAEMARDTKNGARTSRHGAVDRSAVVRPETKEPDTKEPDTEGTDAAGTAASIGLTGERAT